MHRKLPAEKIIKIKTNRGHLNAIYPYITGWKIVFAQTPVTMH